MQRVIQHWKSPEEFKTLQGSFRPNGFGRRCMSVEHMPYRDEAFAAFGFTALRHEPLFRNFVGEHFLDGAHTHEHQDQACSGFMHVRVNWMIKKPVTGGDPVFDGEVVPVNEGDAWVCFASEELHASTPIQGGLRRICSFGALIPRPSDFDIKKFCFNP